ncbi:MAG: hypothetical protein K5905_10090, partial [Roseibium sp.]|uniref:hypothetical protein n=1 Tax=Roseibium sp. TaxID=1936156 RepID=UPI0026300BE1
MVPESETQVKSPEETNREALRAINSILQAQNSKLETANELRKAIEDAENEVDKKDLEEQLRAVNLDLSRLGDQIVSLATGVAESELNPVDENFELQDELEQLIRPFVWILKSATENAREIEHLKRNLLSTTEEAKRAQLAISRVKPLIDQAPQDGPVRGRLQLILLDWQNRLVAAEDKSIIIQQQLRSRLEDKVDPGDAASRAFTS